MDGGSVGARSRAWLISREGRLAGFLILSAADLGVYRNDFLAPSNLRDILVNAAPTIIAAAGMTVIIVGGGIDISIGSLFGACAIGAGAAARSGWPLPAVVLIPLGLGAVAGATNGILIARARIPAIVVTLGMLSIIRGITIYLTGGNEVRDLPDAFRAISLGSALGIANPIAMAASAVVVCSIFLSSTRRGREIYAVGGNATAAALAAIRVSGLQLITYGIGGFSVGLAAMVHAARFSSIQTTTGTGFELVVITAVVLGGTSILGGSGTVIGTTIGALVLETIPNALTFLEVPVYWKPAAQGAVVLLAVFSSASARRRGRS